MTVYLLNAFPNAFLPVTGEEVTLRGITEEEAKGILSQGFTSAIGHESTAHALTQRLGITVAHNRIQVSFQPDDVYVIAAVVLPRRLGEGELLTEGEILDLPIKWVVIGA